MRQYFNASLADSAISAITVGPSTAKTALLTPAQALSYLPIGYGQNAPFPGQIYRCVLGGVITTPASGTLQIDPFYGNGTVTPSFGVDLGSSTAQTVIPGASTVPWRLEADLVFRSVGAQASSSTAGLWGFFMTQGVVVTAGSGWVIAFGTAGATGLDTTGTATAGSWGAINFAVTFSVAGATIITHYTAMQSLN